MKKPGEKLKIAVVYASRHGHTKLLAEAVARGAGGPGCEVELLTTVVAAEALDELDRADAIVFGSPTYMGNIASEMKLFMEKSVGRWFSRAWSGKVAGAFTNSSNFSGDKLNTLTGLMIYAMQQGMIWVGVEQPAAGNEPGSLDTVAGPGPGALNRNSASLGPMASSFAVNVPAAPTVGDLATAEAYGRRIATVAAKLAD